MKSNFFKMLIMCENHIVMEDLFQDEAGVYPSYSGKTEKAVLKFIAYIESGCMFHAKVPIFICKHWRMRPKELTGIWESETGKKKREDTFRGQVSEASVQLYSIFGDHVFEGLLMDDLDTARSVSGTVSILRTISLSPSAS